MAATRIVGKNARMYVNDIALYLRAFEMENTMELNTEEATAFGVDWQEFELIDGTVSMGINAFMDSTRPPDDTSDLVTDAAYINTFQADGGNVFKSDPIVPLIFVPNNTAVAGDKAFFMDSILGSLAISAPRSGLQRLRGRFQGAQSLRAGLIIAQTEASFSTGDNFLPVPTTGIDVGINAAITSSSIANPTVITTATPHGIKTGQTVTIEGHITAVPDINGTHIATRTGATTLTIPVNVTTGGTGGTITNSLGTAVAYCVYKKTGSTNVVLDLEDSVATGGPYATSSLFPLFAGISADYREDTVDAGKRFHRIRINLVSGPETLGIIVVSTNIRPA